MSTASDTQTLQRTKFKSPAKWTVVLHNDDFTPMDFVVAVLTTVFGLDQAGAIEIMMRVHEEGRSTVGQYTKEVAQMKALQVLEIAEENKHPLLATPEELPSE